MSLKQKLGQYVEKLKEEEKILETGNYGFDNPLTSVIHAKLDTCKVIREKLEKLLEHEKEAQPKKIDVVEKIHEIE